MAESEKKGGFFQAAREFLYGLAAHDHMLFALKEKASIERVFFLIIMGDMLGIPMWSSYYSLRLLPHAMPRISQWKRSMLREKDLTDAFVE